MANKNRPIRQAAVNIILAAAFIVMIFVIATPFIAEGRFDSARRLEDDYRWPKAEAEFEAAARIDRFNAEYPAGLGAFLLKKSEYADNKAPLFERAAKLYERALELNPRSAEYALGAGRARIGLFLEDKEKHKEELRKAFGHFETALRNDPNGFNISYSVGYVGMLAWESLDREERELILDRLRFSLKSRPSYGRYIRPLVWRKTKDLGILNSITPSDERGGRLQKIEEIKKTSAFKQTITEAISKEEWQGIAADGKNIYKSGNMYWTGTVDAVLSVPKGDAMIGIQAKGDPAGGVFPYMVIELDGKWIGETEVGPEWKEYEFSVDTDGGIKVLSVTFTNDGQSADGSEDRNLYLGAARVIKR